MDTQTLKIPPLQNDLINAKGEGGGAQHLISAKGRDGKLTNCGKSPSSKKALLIVIKVLKS